MLVNNLFLFHPKTLNIKIVFYFQVSEHDIPSDFVEVRMKYCYLVELQLNDSIDSTLNFLNMPGLCTNYPKKFCRLTWVNIINYRVNCRFLQIWRKHFFMQYLQ